MSAAFEPAAGDGVRRRPCVAVAQARRAPCQTLHLPGNFPTKSSQPAAREVPTPIVLLAPARLNKKVNLLKTKTNEDQERRAARAKCNCSVFVSFFSVLQFVSLQRLALIL